MEIITNRASPIAASQAANTKRIIGAMLARVKCEFRMVRVIRMNNDNTMPSRHSNADIRWDRYISRPVRDIVKAIRMLMWTKDIWYL